MRPPLLVLCVLPLGAALAAGCNHTPAASPADAPAGGAYDEHSYAEPDMVRTVDLALDLNLDFGEKRIAGLATHTLEWRDNTATRLVLDSRDLEIARVEGEGQDGRWTPLRFALAAKDDLLGSKLTIETPERNRRVRIAYATSPDASGLQWLTREMTESKRIPFMFSQSQAIHARSWVPLQDTPQVRFTYSAEVTSPMDTMVLMSADNDPAAVRDGSYSFKMPQAIPSYLLAIAAGDLAFQAISERSGVWAEPVAVDRAAAEFADTEKMIEVAEQLYGPYRWGRYDMLVLPPSFPFGGMENPRLSFITPTVITGDRSLVSVIAHELAHSWSGNLVTSASAKDGWLNEGFTTYVENRIIEVLYGRERSDMELVIARNALRAQLPDVAPEVQSLRPRVVRDPDDAVAGILYDKGAWFLQFLEQRYGREAFDSFLRSYFDHFAFQGITTAQFVDYLETNLMTRAPGKVTEAELDEWLYEPGIPASAPETSTPRLAAIDDARQTWLDGGALPGQAITAKWSTQEWVHFLERMPEKLSVERMTALDAAYEFTGTPNGEIAERWYPLAVRSSYAAANDAMEVFMLRVGRRKLIMPIYRALTKTPEGFEFAKEVFAEARPGYHPITTASVEALFVETTKLTEGADN